MYFSGYSFYNHQKTDGLNFAYCSRAAVFGSRIQGLLNNTTRSTVKSGPLSLRYTALFKDHPPESVLSFYICAKLCDVAVHRHGLPRSPVSQAVQ